MPVWAGGRGELCLPFYLITATIFSLGVFSLCKDTTFGSKGVFQCISHIVVQCCTAGAPACHGALFFSGSLLVKLKCRNSVEG